MALSKIKTNSIADNAITSTKIGVDVIVAEDLASNSITVAEIASNAVTTAKIADANVTSGKLASSITITTLTGTNDATISGLTVGKGAGSDSGSTVLGSGALAGSNTGANNLAIGKNALAVNTSGAQNTGLGYATLNANTSGADNVAIGHIALYGNTTGSSNVAIGRQALQANTTASYNTAVGYQALYANITGAGVTAIGWGAGIASTGNYNTFVGWRSGEAVTSGTDNTIIGGLVGLVSTGSQNIFIGGPISGVSNGTASLMTTGSKNTIIGRFNGNQGGLDIRTANNHIVLSDGDGNPNGYCNSNKSWYFTAAGNAGEPGIVNVRQTGATNSATMDIRQTGAGGNGGQNIGLVVSIDAQASNDRIITGQFWNGGTPQTKFYVQRDGSVLSATGSYGTISDARLKQDITDASSQWEDFKKIKFRKYRMITDVEADANAPFFMGVVAQELEEADMYGLVETPVQVDGTELTKQVKLSILYMKAAKALQETMERLENLETQFDEYKRTHP